VKKDSSLHKYVGLQIINIESQGIVEKAGLQTDIQFSAFILLDNCRKNKYVEECRKNIFHFGASCTEVIFYHVTSGQIGMLPIKQTGK
jgi:hypothetical protein